MNTNNNITKIISYLEQNPLTTENKIFNDVFQFDRHNSIYSNKRYADTLRLALRRGKIARTEVKVWGKKDRFYYFIPR